MFNFPSPASTSGDAPDDPAIRTIIPRCWPATAAARGLVRFPSGSGREHETDARTAADAGRDTFDDGCSSAQRHVGQCTATLAINVHADPSCLLPSTATMPTWPLGRLRARRATFAAPADLFQVIPSMAAKFHGVRFPAAQRPVFARSASQRLSDVTSLSGKPPKAMSKTTVFVVDYLKDSATPPNGTSAQARRRLSNDGSQHRRLARDEPYHPVFGTVPRIGINGKPSAEPGGRRGRRRRRRRRGPGEQ